MAKADLSALSIERGDRGTGASRGGRTRGLGFTALIVAALAAAGYLALGARGRVAVEAVSVTTAYPSQAFTLLNATGYVVAQRKAAVSTKATGRLEWLGVAEGSKVKAGEIIARLENRDVTAAMEQAEANVKVANANLEQGVAELKDAEAAYRRSLDLVERKFVAPSAHDAAVARLEKARAAISGYRASIAMAQANLRGARVAVEQTLVRAPFDGVVLTKNANIGDVMAPFSSATGSQAAVVTMADMSSLEVEADVSESNLAKVSAGQPCEVQLDAIPDTRFAATVHRLVPTVDRAKATVMTKIRFDAIDPRVLPEMSAKVGFLSRPVAPQERAPRSVVLPGAVVTRGGANVVFLIRDGRAVESRVELGGRIGDLVEIKSGARAGDQLVARPTDSVTDGVRVSLAGK
ncbi:MAG TPA: efflux RND transporter periplasmic adaptor subunit [Burkholderiales bacterium]|nr:efflux RND transporter periplasmic adaptor subunit [Burkholderiales bacterium]